jgi:hypothetical protein
VPAELSVPHLCCIRYSQTWIPQSRAWNCVYQSVEDADFVKSLAQIWVYWYVLIYVHGQELMSSGYNFTRLWLHSLSSTISTILTSEVCFLMLSTFGVRLLGPKGMCGASRSPYVWKNTACVYPSNHIMISLNSKLPLIFWLLVTNGVCSDVIVIKIVKVEGSKIVKISIVSKLDFNFYLLSFFS